MSRSVSPEEFDNVTDLWLTFEDVCPEKKED